MYKLSTEAPLTGDLRSTTTSYYALGFHWWIQFMEDVDLGEIEVLDLGLPMVEVEVDPAAEESWAY